MQIAPLIHSRTLYCDFNPNFAVRPADLDVSWAMKKVLQSTTDIDILNGARLLTANNGNVGIVGIACKFRYFIENYAPEFFEEAQQYFQDERGREVKIFLGYAFKGGGVPDVPFKDFWKFFKENLAPKWDFKVAETVISSYENCGEKNISNKISPANKINGIDFFTAGNDEKLFEQCIAAKKNFCSNVDQFKIITSGEFNAILTSQSNIDRYKSEQEKKTPQSAQTSAPRQSPTTQTPTRQHIQPPRQESSKIAMTVTAAVILIILAAAGYLLT